MTFVFDENNFYNLKVSDVSEWYSKHHTEQDLADVYELVHRLWTYYEDCTYDYEEETPEYKNAVKRFEEWDALQNELEKDILTALRKHNINAEHLDTDALETFMGMHQYENRGGWFIKKEQ